jgi:hydroxymethylpyrimidine pyrophosphatase-like HAD family hydrolase
VSIDVVPRSLEKEAGMRWLSKVTGVSLQNMAYIGDANGDIGALQLVGHSFAPANAAADVKSVVDTVTNGSDIDGVIEAYQTVISARREAGFELITGQIANSVGP